ncbi:MAG TPA: amino acid permease, partial [Gemmataceae bacterium]|nr:amino acid permease [Gemmataceae bacterium]
MNDLADRTNLTRGIGPWQATALNVTLVVGAGVFVTIPMMLGKLPGPYALWGWIAAGVLIFFDGLIWSELGAAMPTSGGTYHYLLECYGRDRWGRLFAFLFIWQFLLSGPLELGSGLVAVAQFSSSLSPAFEKFNDAWTWKWMVWKQGDDELAILFGPSRVLSFLLGLAIVLLLFRN